jgi:hypothetical protein
LNMVICPEVWICPSCGSRVHLPASSLGEITQFSEQLCNRLARCMCVCYVRSLSDTWVGMLFAAMLNAGDTEGLEPDLAPGAADGASQSPRPAA